MKTITLTSAEYLGGVKLGVIKEIESKSATEKVVKYSTMCGEVLDRLVIITECETI